MKLEAEHNDEGEVTTMRKIDIPENGFEQPPEIAMPNIFPIEWRVETPKLVEIYERAKREGSIRPLSHWNSLIPNSGAATSESRSCTGGRCFPISTRRGLLFSRAR